MLSQKSLAAFQMFLLGLLSLFGVFAFMEILQQAAARSLPVAAFCLTAAVVLLWVFVWQVSKLIKLSYLRVRQWTDDMVCIRQV